MNSKPEPKLRGGGDSELTRFKRLWRDTLPESSREYWRSQFESNATQPEIRAEINAKTGINLLYDRQLTEFREWEWNQRLRSLEEERMGEDQRELMKDHADWTLDQVREEVLKRSYARSMATGDFKLGLATMDRDLNLKTGKTMADQGRQKIEISREKLAQMREKIALEREKLIQLSCQKILKAAQDPGTRAVAEDTALSNAEKIALMRKEYFADIDELEKSGKVVLPE
jgi:hypothetical protein